MTIRNIFCNDNHYNTEYIINLLPPDSMTRAQEVPLGCWAPLIHGFNSLKNFTPAPPRFFKPEPLI